MLVCLFNHRVIGQGCFRRVKRGKKMPEDAFQFLPLHFPCSQHALGRESHSFRNPFHEPPQRERYTHSSVASH